MKRFNLVEILKDCPKGTTLYSTVHGNVELECVDNSDYAIKVTATTNGQRTPAWFTSDGRYFRYYLEGDCVLFPSKNCRDWSQFKLVDKDENDAHWQEVKERAAIAAMQGTLAILGSSDRTAFRDIVVTGYKGKERTYHKEIAEFAVACADALVEQLKK